MRGKLSLIVNIDHQTTIAQVERCRNFTKMLGIRVQAMNIVRRCYG
jgi:hypothetical protein